ncbi:MAG TPA: MBOAT family O-acyltransferase [Bryobacteraceae bacterium]|nr:MBOAT family O-acyltransferase [Bryobacteraceae bacterium]
MLFTIWAFWIFVVVVLALFYASPRRVRPYILLAASLYFYMWWNQRFVIFLLALITIDYSAALWIDTCTGWRRRLALLLSLSANLGFLGWFKYTNFLIATWTGLVHPGAQPRVLDIILPLGISFHTFQSISYVVDVYRGKQRTVRNYFHYALYVAFFPQLVAGPIVRAREFFPDLWAWRAPVARELQRGTLLIVMGLVKKLVFADQFALVADSYFKNPQAFPGFLPAWTGTFAFALQIFFDFSGYTDIAIGTALLFGFHFPENFRRPYLSASITEFWRRWHMSLSSWLRDYLYIPLGGNRHGAWHTYRNLLLTMLLGGLWHGASWNFVIWGGYHGALLAVERPIYGKSERRGVIRIPLVALTFLLVSISWVFFRAGTLPSAIYVLGQMTAGHGGESLLSVWHWRMAAFSLAVALAEEYGNVLTRLQVAPAWLRTATVVLALLAIELFGVTEQHLPFVYFQF